MAENEIMGILENIYEKYVRDCDSDEEYVKNNFAITESVKALSEIHQYRAIGTVEEIKKMKKEEDILKFYYCESEDEYYIGKRIDTMYYAKYSKTGFVWCMSRHLPWGEHVVAPNTLWKEHTYPSEPKEIPFFEWLQGFIKKYCLGTVEECREARERQMGKKPYLYGGTRQGLDNDGNSISKEENCYECPTCDQFLGYEIDCKDEHYQVDYCPYCGQAIDWSDTP